MNKRTEVKKSTNGLGFCGALTIALIVLKLLDKITWSWIWVLSPMWISILLFIVLCIVAIIVVNG